MVRNPHRAQISQFELFELILLLRLDKQFPVEQFGATELSQQYPPPLLEVERMQSRGGGQKRNNKMTYNNITK